MLNVMGRRTTVIFWMNSWSFFTCIFFTAFSTSFFSSLSLEPSIHHPAPPPTGSLTGLHTEIWMFLTAGTFVSISMAINMQPQHSCRDITAFIDFFISSQENHAAQKHLQCTSVQTWTDLEYVRKLNKRFLSVGCEGKNFKLLAELAFLS